MCLIGPCYKERPYYTVGWACNCLSKAAEEVVDVGRDAAEETSDPGLGRRICGPLVGLRTPDEFHGPVVLSVLEG